MISTKCELICTESCCFQWKKAHVDVEAEGTIREVELQAKLVEMTWKEFRLKSPLMSRVFL